VEGGTGQVVADVCSPSYRFVWQIDRTYAVASQQVMTGCNHFWVLEIRYLIGVKSFDRRAKEKHCARYGRDIPHLLLSESIGAARLSRPNW
jgi:hypothetical protein